MKEAINRIKWLLSWSDRIGSEEISELNKIVSILKNSNDLKWIAQLMPIIEEYGNDEPLDGDDVDRLTENIKAKINLDQGNITENEYQLLMNNNPNE